MTSTEKQTTALHLTSCISCDMLLDDDAETCMVGNDTICLKCYEEDDSDDECFIQYRKEIEDGCPEGHKTIWDNYGFRYEEDNSPNNMDINTKMGLMMMAKSVIDERAKCRIK